MSWRSIRTEDWWPLGGSRTAHTVGPPAWLVVSPLTLPNASLHRHATQEGLGARFVGDIGIVQPAARMTAVSDRNLRRHPPRADFEAPGAARMEPATGGWVRQVGRLAGHRLRADRL